MASFAFRTIIKSVLSTLTVDNSGRLEQLGDIQVTVTNPRLVLLATQQTNKSQGVGTRNNDFIISRLAGRKDDRLASQKTSPSEFGLLYTNWGGRGPLWHQPMAEQDR